MSLYALVGLLTIFVIGYLWSTSNPEFKMKGLPPELSREVSAVVEGYSRVEVASDGSNFTVTAKKATTFVDNHQEFEGVRIEFPGAEGPDVVSAERAIFLPGKGNGFKLFLERSVDLTSSSGFNVRASSMVYDNGTSIGETDGPVEFSRGELNGSARGARYDSRSGEIDLLGKISIRGSKGDDSSGELARLGVSRLDATSNRGVISAREKTIALKDDVRFTADVLPDSNGSVPSEMSAKSIEIRLAGNNPSAIKSTGGVKARFLPTRNRKQQIDMAGDELDVDLSKGGERASLNGSVKIKLIDEKKAVTQFDAPRLSYTFADGRVSGDGGVRLERKVDGVIQTASAGRIDYSVSGRVFTVRNRSRFVSGSDFFEAEIVTGRFGVNDEIVSLSGEGAAKLGRDDDRGKSETTARKFQASFNSGQRLRDITATGPVRSRFASGSAGESVTEVLAPTAMKIAFDSSGNASNLVTQGRTSISLNDRNGGSDKAGTLTADSVVVRFDPKDRSVRTAEAQGNAEILMPEESRGVTKVNSESFLCDFIAASNRVERCQSISKASARRTSGSESQNLDAGRIGVFFASKDGVVDYLQADGKARFSQGEANGTADRITYRPQSAIATLQGQPVQFWDNRARSKSKLVEWDTAKKTVTLSGEVSTTYYNQAQTAGSLPFKERSAPVYVTANRSIVRIVEDSVVFEGKARAWQRDNFISAESLEVQRLKRRLIAKGGVRTLLFDVPKGTSSKSNLTVSGTSQSFSYDDSSKTAIYEKSVDLRQGEDRVQGAIVTVKISNDGNVSSFDVKGNVVLTQAGRRATGDEAIYDVVGRKVNLKGSPARVVESGRGAAEGGSLTYFLDDKRVVGEGKSERDSNGRVRSVYQIDKQ